MMYSIWLYLLYRFEHVRFYFLNWMKTIQNRSCELGIKVVEYFWRGNKSFCCSLNYYVTSNTHTKFDMKIALSRMKDKSKKYLNCLQNKLKSWIPCSIGVFNSIYFQILPHSILSAAVCTSNFSVFYSVMYCLTG